jgi:hypothetical protein
MSTIKDQPVIKQSVLKHAITFRDKTQSFATAAGTRLTLNLLTWTIWRAPTNASKWRRGVNSAFKGLIGLRIMNQ